MPVVRDTTGALTRPIVDVYVNECAGRKNAIGLWPTKGKAVAAALPAESVKFIPETPPFFESEGAFHSVMLPDQRAWGSGVRAGLCTVYNLTADGGARPIAGDLRAMETAKPLPGVRACVSETDVVPCDKAHPYEALFNWGVTGFPAGDSSRWTDEQWAPYRATCKAVIDILVGAKRTDLAPAVIAGAPFFSKARGKDIANFFCAAKRADGKALPPGTVVGLGNKPLKA